MATATENCNLTNAFDAPNRSMMSGAYRNNMNNALKNYAGVYWPTAFDQSASMLNAYSTLAAAASSMNGSSTISSAVVDSTTTMPASDGGVTSSVGNCGQQSSIGSGDQPQQSTSLSPTFPHTPTGFGGFFSTNPLMGAMSRASHPTPKKKAQPVPDHAKDNGYWERRRRNNESARRSRESRRCKEEQIAVRVIFLEQENVQLKTEIAMLRSETEKLRMLLCSGGMRTGGTNTNLASHFNTHQMWAGQQKLD